jgi:hypothetical protein
MMADLKMVNGANTKSRALICLFVVVILAQCLLFRAFVLRELAWAYPHNDDQVGYLSQTYDLFEAIRSSPNGAELFSMLVGQRAEISATGVMLPFQAAIAFFFFGASRLTALSLNLIYFLLWQLTTFFAVRYLTRSSYIAALSWALVLALGSPLLLVGGLFDFRFDSISLSLFGIFIATVMASNVFSHLKLSILSGFVVALLILFRYLTAAYLLGIYAATLFICAFLYFKKRDNLSLRRILNILSSGALVLLLAGPSVWVSRKAIIQYYGNSSFDHSIWNSVDPGAGRLALYVHTVAFYHLGAGLLLVALALVVLAVVSSLLQRRTSSFDLNLSLSGLFVFACLFVPFLLIFYAAAENPVAPGVTVVPILWLILLFIIYLKPPLIFANQLAPVWRFIRFGIAVIVLGFAVSNQLAAYYHRVFPAEESASLHEINRLFDEMGNYCVKAGWDSPGISADTVQDYLGLTEGCVLTPLYYERSGRLLKAKAMIGGSLFPPDRQSIPGLLENTDILILTEADQARFKSGLPVMANLMELRPALMQLAKREFIKLGSYMIDGTRATVHVRPSVSIEGISGDWITFDGITLRIPSNICRPAARIVLRGPSSTLSDLKVLASIANAERTELAAGVTMDAAGYQIEIRLPDHLPTPIADELSVKVLFSHYFQVSDVYPGSPDKRKLVLWKPSICRMIFE